METNESYLWTLDMTQVQIWLRDNHALFPKHPRLRVDPEGNLLPSAEMNEEDIAKIKIDKQASILFTMEQKELQEKELVTFHSQTAIAEVLFSNLVTALDSAANSPPLSSYNEEGDNIHEPNAKRVKLLMSRDAYRILDPSIAQGKDISYMPGAILSRLTFGGIMNALSGYLGGVVDVCTGIPTLPEISRNKNTPIPTAANLLLYQLENTYAKALHQSIHARLEIDVLNSTPSRIIDMLCPEVTMQEIQAIRKRIYDTVVLRKGTHSSAAVASLEGTEDLPLAAKVGVSDIEKYQNCKTCGNNQQSLFVLDKKNGDLICSECGTVATESLMHEGTQFRKFEGEEDRNTHGDIANPLFSNAHNMSTTLGGMNFHSGPGFAGAFASKRSAETVLRNAHSYIEMNISQFGKDEKKTRIGYKDRQKKDAFVKMNHVGDSLSLHQAVIQRAKEFFAGFRDDRELVQQFKGVIAACLIESFEQFSKDGKKLLKLRSGDELHSQNIKARSSKRLNLQNSSVVTVNGGFLVMTRKEAKSSSETSDGAPKIVPSSHVSELELKPVALWDLDDTRSWLLEASRSIARQWFDHNQQEDKSSKAPKPETSLDELEGKLVQHTLNLCAVLETELNNTGTRSCSHTTQRISTPRVSDMGTLGIKWQHVKRGGFYPDTQQNNCSKTSGQLLILKSAKKLGELINDMASGDALYKELRAILRRQDDRKKKEQSEDLIKQRLIQIQRKPWLHVRVEK